MNRGSVYGIVTLRKGPAEPQKGRKKTLKEEGPGNMKDVKAVYVQSCIRNVESLSKELGVSDLSDRKKAEEAIFLAAMEKWGPELGKHICGRYAVVFEDPSENKLYLIRDHFGQEPLYYCVADGILYYSSDIRELIRQSGIKKEINEKTIAAFFVYGYPLGPETFFQGVKKLQAGHRLVWDMKKKEFAAEGSWFQPEYKEDTFASEEEWIKRTESVLETIMEEERKDMEKDDPVCLLSSGVDSSYLLAASGIPRAAGISYPDKGFSEAESAEETAKILGRGFTKYICTPEEFLENHREYVSAADQPIVNPTVPVIAGVCKRLCKETELIYSGEGADELFLGYFDCTPLEMLYRTRKPYFGFAFSTGLKDLQMLFKADCSWIAESIPEEISRDTRNARPQYAARWMDTHLTFEGDTCAYASYLRSRFNTEVRLPYADPRLFDISSKVPMKYLLHKTGKGIRLLPGIFGKRNDEPHMTGKYIFRKLAAKKLPEKIAFRNKRAFPAPVRTWMQSPPLREYFQELIFSNASERFFNMDYVRNLWDACRSGDTKGWRILYAIGTFIGWYHETFEKQ